MEQRIAYLLTDILQRRQRGSRQLARTGVLALSRPAAVKTGTTTDFRDNWTIGYTPNLVVGVWVGNADNEPMQGVTGITGAAPIWHGVMDVAHKGLPIREFERPAGLDEVEVCALSGHLPGPDCPQDHRALREDRTHNTVHGAMHVRVGDQVMIALPTEAHAWGKRTQRANVASPNDAIRDLSQAGIAQSRRRRSVPHR